MNYGSINWNSTSPIEFSFSTSGIGGTYRFPRTDGATGDVLINDGSGNLEWGGSGAIQLPQGSSTERPSPLFGMIRYNTTIGRGEMYVNDLNGDGTQGDAGWRPL